MRAFQTPTAQPTENVVPDAVIPLEHLDTRLAVLRAMVQAGIDDFDRGNSAILNFDHIRAEARRVRAAGALGPESRE